MNFDLATALALSGFTGLAPGVSTAGRLPEFALRKACAWGVPTAALVAGWKSGKTLPAG